MSRRSAVQLSTRVLILHECGYKCSNPACRMVLTLDVHHIEYVSEGGSNTQENLLALCPNCHALHHKGHIPLESLRAWKLLLLALNEAFDRKAVDTLLALDILKGLMVSGDGLLSCAPLLASKLLDIEEKTAMVETSGSVFGPAVEIEDRVTHYWITLSPKGREFVEAWKRGDQSAAIGIQVAVTKRKSHKSAFISSA